MKTNKKIERVVSTNSNDSVFIFRKDISAPSYAPAGLLTNCISRAEHKWVNRPGWRSYTVLTRFFVLRPNKTQQTNKSGVELTVQGLISPGCGGW
jgi:hypothetical protein